MFLSFSIVYSVVNLYFGLSIFVVVILPVCFCSVLVSLFVNLVNSVLLHFLNFEG